MSGLLYCFGFGEIDGVVVLLCVGGVLVYFIEVVFGFGCDLQDLVVFECLFVFKQWLVDQGVLLIVVELDQFECYFVFDQLFEVQWQVVLVSWLGLYMWVFLCLVVVLVWVMGVYEGIVVCIIVYFVVVVLCCVFGGVIVFISVNLYGVLLVWLLQEVIGYFGDVLDGLFVVLLGEVEQFCFICDGFSGVIICF